GVRCLLVVPVEVLAPAAADADRRIQAKEPASHVQGVNAVVAQFPRAVIPVPVPVIMEAVGIERPLGCRAEPKVVIDSARNGSVLLVADARPLTGNPGAGERHLAELAGTDKLGRTGV